MLVCIYSGVASTRKLALILERAARSSYTTVLFGKLRLANSLTDGSRVFMVILDSTPSPLRFPYSDSSLAITRRLLG